MNRLIRSLPFGGTDISVFILLGIVVCAATSVEAQSIRKDAFAEIGIDQRLEEQVPLDLEFTNERGVQVRLGDYFGSKPVLLSLVYYECPMLCGQVLNGLLQSLQVLPFDVGGEFDVVTVSFDPGETAELAAKKKRTYLKRYNRPGSEQGWHFLTGNQDQIDKLTEAVGFRYEYDAETDNYIHASGIMVLTPSGKLSRYFYGIEFPPKDLRLGLVESAAEQIGSVVDQLLLLCYHYDPETGTYGLAIMNTIRVAGFATVAVLAICIVATVRRDRKQTTMHQAEA